MATGLTLSKTLVLVATAGIVATATAGCSSTSSSPSASPTPATSSASPTATATATTTAKPTTTPSGMCTSEALLAVIPTGSTMVKYNCAMVGGTQWAAAVTGPTPNQVFFFQVNKGKWEPTMGSEICGTANAGLPPELLAYCNTPTKK